MMFVGVSCVDGCWNSGTFFLPQEIYRVWVFVPARTHKLTESHTIVHYNFLLVYLYIMAGGLTMVMDAIVATVVDGGQEIVDIDIEAGRNKLIFHLLYSFTLNPSTAASSNPFWRGFWGWGVFIHRTHATGEANCSIVVGMLVRCMFCYQKAFQVGVLCSCQNELSRC